MKGNKLVITFILALIVCLVLIPTCAFAEGTEILSNEPSLVDAGNSPAQPSVETLAETPSEPPAETPSEPPAETPSEPPVETPSEPPVETPSEPDAGYTVEFTVGDKQYVLAGDSSVDLSEILGDLGISGEISEASSSDDSLFSVAQDENGNWTVSANECFSSTQSMTVVVAGQKYKIVVTDDAAVCYVDEDGNLQNATTISNGLNNVANGGTVTLMTDKKGPVTFSKDKTVILDLGGNSLSASTLFPNDPTLKATKGNLTIKNGTINGEIRVSASAHVTLASDVTLNGMLVVIGKGSGDTAETPVANVYGTISNTGAQAISTNGTDRSGAVINIYDGAKVTSDDIAIYLPSGNLNVYGGTITGATGIYVKGGSLNVTGGEIIATAPDKEPDLTNDNGASATGDSIVIEDADTPTSGYGPITSVSISGGTLISKNADPLLSVSRSGENGPVTKFVTGGTFSSVPEEELLSGDNTVISAGELYAVGSKGNMASVNALMANAGDNTITVYSAPDGITAPEGSTVVNKTNSAITVNGVVLQPGQSITIPVSPVAVRGDYYIIEGKDQTWTKGSNEELSFKLNSGKLIKVLIDGEEVEFEITEDGLVTIAPEVLEALEPGVHTITFVYVDGGISTNIVIEA